MNFKISLFRSRGRGLHRISGSIYLTATSGLVEGTDHALPLSILSLRLNLPSAFTHLSSFCQSFASVFEDGGRVSLLERTRSGSRRHRAERGAYLWRKDAIFQEQVKSILFDVLCHKPQNLTSIFRFTGQPRRRYHPIPSLLRSRNPGFPRRSSYFHFFLEQIKE